MRPGRYAAIDIGTVTCRLLVADVDDQGLHTLAKGYQITNLGEGVDASGRLLPAAMERVGVAVEGFQGQISQLMQPDAPVAVTAFATSASRDAENAQDFVDLLKDKGVTLTVIPGQREAALTFKGACCDYPGEQVLVVDIGGGSTEVVAGRSGKDPDKAHSFNIGCRRMTERFLASDPPSAQEVEDAAQWVRQEMGDYFQSLRDEGLLPARMIAVAGTATSVVSVHLAMKEYDSSKVQGFQVSREVLRSVYDGLASVPVSERMDTIGLDPGRAPVICAGLIILQVVMELAGVDSYTASESDILQGIILEAAQ